jgi:hypothetical protein
LQTYRESPFADPGNDMGEHTEGPTQLEPEREWYLFANSDQPVDISGWGLTVGTIYQVEISLTAASAFNCWVEVQFLYEAP